MVEFLKIRNVKSPEREKGNAGIDAFIPEYSKEFANLLREKNPGFDITEDYIIIQPSKAVLIPSGLKTKFKESVALIATNKSGQATKKRLQVGATCVDSNYRGEVHLHVYNTGSLPVKIYFGEKLVQFVPYLIDTDSIEVKEGITEEDFYGSELETNRNEGGFGSTGTGVEPERIRKSGSNKEKASDKVEETPEETTEVEAAE